MRQTQVAFLNVSLSTMRLFNKEFKTLFNVIKKSDSILLFTHSYPDADAVGSVLALKKYLESLSKKTTLGCLDPFPDFLKNLSNEKFANPATLDLASFDLIIACDSVEHGFDKIFPEIKDEKVVALLDHHPDITLQGDINIIDPTYSSTCEIVYDFFLENRVEINREMATFILLGILGDTGIFQHSNTTPKVMEIASALMKKGATLSKIVSTNFSNKKMSTLKLWGKTFEKAQLNKENRMIISVITKKDLSKCGATTEDISQVAEILNTVPGTKFSLILSERAGDTIKGSLRSEDYKGVDVSKIARSFGGGGHKLAAGFEVKGKIIETKDGWKIV